MKSARVAQEGFLLPLQRDLWTDQNSYDPLTHRPEWRNSEVANTFFARSRQWLQWHVQRGHAEMNGRPIALRHNDHGSRVWRLVDIEQLAHGLFARGILDYHQLQRTVFLVKIIAQNYGFLPWTGFDAVVNQAVIQFQGVPADRDLRPPPAYTPPQSASAEIREWARIHGYRVGRTGIVPRHIVAAYKEAHP